jgi:hypothetical protein
MTARVLIGLARMLTTVVARHDAGHAAPVQGAAPGTTAPVT